MNIHSIIKLLSLIVHTFLGSYVLLRSPRNRLNQAFSLTTLSIAVMELGYFMLLLTSGRTLWIRVMLIGQCLVAGNIILLSLIYGRENYEDFLKARKFYLVTAYSVSLIFLIIAFAGLLKFELVDEYPNYGLAFTRQSSPFVLFLLVSTLIALINLENTYRQARQKSAIQYPIIMFIGMLSFHLLAYSLSLGFSFMEVEVLTVVSITRIIANAFIAYPVIRPKPGEARIYVGRAVIARSYTMLLAGIYLLIIGMLGKIVQIIGKNLNLFLAFLALFFILLVLMAGIVAKPMKRRFQEFIERNFYKSKYDYRREWENFSKRVFSILSTKELLQEILETISETISADIAAIMLLDEHKREFFVASPEKMNVKYEIRDLELESSVPSPMSHVLPADDMFLDWLWRYGAPIRISDGKCYALRTFSEPPDVPDLILNVGGWEKGGQKVSRGSAPRVDSVCIPIIAENKLIAIIILSRIKQKTNYSQEDMNLLETMANQISIAIMNARKSEELALSKELESFYKLSALLLHDLKSSASMLSLIVQNAVDNLDNPEFRKDALNTLSSVVNKIQKLIQKLSTAPQKGSLHLQPANLNEIVSDAIALSGIKNLPRIKVVEELSPMPKTMLDPENIERVVLNLIINAAESISGDGVITIRSCQNSNGYIQVSISDTGCGMSQEFIRYRLFQPFQTTKNKGLGIGLYQCKAIIDTYGGAIDVQSQQGVGSTFTINLPIISKVKL